MSKTDKKTSRERRKSKRVPFREKPPLRYEINNSVKEARAVDYSHSGLSIDAEAELISGAHVNMVLMDGAITFSGRVLHQLPEDSGSLRTGIELEPGTGPILEALIYEDNGPTEDEDEPTEEE